MTGAGFDSPFRGSLALFNDDRHGVKGDSRTYVGGDTVKTVADIQVQFNVRFYYQMFLAVRDRAKIGRVEEVHARVRVFGRDGFVAKIKAKAARSRFADDTSEDERCVKKVEILQPAAVIIIP